MPEFLWKWRRELVLLLLAAVSMCMLITQHQPGKISRIASQGLAFIVVPLQKTTTVVAGQIGLFFTGWASAGRLRSENARLRAQMDRLVLERHLTLESIRENTELRKILGYKQQAPWEFIPADLIGRDPASWLLRTVVDRGSTDGVKPGAGVITPDGAAGRVLEANLYSATIMLLPDPQSAVPGMVERSRVTGTLKGTGQELLKFLYVPNGEDVRPGDALLTSKLSTLFPPGIPMGEVVAVKPAENGLMLDIDVKPRVPFKNLERFLILKLEE